MENGGLGRIGIGLRAAVLLVLAYWSSRMAPTLGPYSVGLLDLTNLVFHEAGHILFLPLGSFMMSLGGSLTQLLIPLVCTATFIVKNRDHYAAAVALWWAGENLVDIAPYVADARALQLVLLGGHTGAEVFGHDWEAILGRSAGCPTMSPSAGAATGWECSSCSARSRARDGRSAGSTRS